MPHAAFRNVRDKLKCSHATYCKRWQQQHWEPLTAPLRPFRVSRACMLAALFAYGTQTRRPLWRPADNGNFSLTLYPIAAASSDDPFVQRVQHYQQLALRW